MLFEDIKNKLIQNGYLPLNPEKDHFQYWIDVRYQGKPIYFYIEWLAGTEVVTSGFKIDSTDSYDTVNSFSAEEVIKISRMS